MTTLEQIKQRQEEINIRLSNLLEDQENLVITLLGEPSGYDENVKGDFPEGLIEKLNFLQDGTENIIAKIYYNLRKLQEAVYTPTIVQG